MELLSTAMAPELGETQATPHFGSAPWSSSSAAGDGPDDSRLPTMEDIDGLVSELDLIDATLAQIG